MELRDYQRSMVDDINAGGESVLCLAPTGAGKTVVIADLAKRTSNALVIEPWRALVDQTVDALGRHGVEASPLMAGRPGGGGVRVASLETAARRDLPKFDLVLVDEAHRVDTDARRALLDRVSGGRVVHFTATGWTERGPLSGFDTVVIGPSPSELIGRGLLRRPRYTSGGAGDVFRRARGGQCVVYCDSVAESKAYAAAHDRIEHVDGTTPGRARLELMKRFRAGEIDALANCAVLTEGFDAKIDGVALRPGGMNLRLFVQAVGRGIRPGQRTAWVGDPAGLCRVYGCPTALPWPLWSDCPTGDRKGELAEARKCRELGAFLEDGEIEPAEPQIHRLALECGLGAEWEAQQWCRRGRPWRAGRARVQAQLEGAGVSRGEIAARLRRVGL